MKLFAKTLDKNSDWVAALFFSLLVVFLKFPILHLPYYWDEMGAYAIPAHWLSTEPLSSILPWLHPKDAFFGHPPALYLTAAMFYRMFGESLLVSHVIILIFSIAGLFFTYKLGEYFHSKLTGLAAALFLFFTPLYFTQSGMFLADLPLTALGTASVYFMLRKKYGFFLAASVYMVLIKELGIFMIGGLALYLFLTNRKVFFKSKEFLACSIPVLILLLHTAFQIQTLTEMAQNAYLIAPTQSAIDFLKNVIRNGRRAAQWIFLEQERIWVTSAVIYYALLFRRFQRETLLCLSVALFYILFFSFILMLPRYIMPTLPYLCIAGSIAIRMMVKKSVPYLLMIGFILHLSFRNNFVMGPGVNFETNMHYVDVVRAYQKTASFIESNYSKSRVFGLWPFPDMLTKPYVGYVQRALEVVEKKEPFDILILTPHGDPKYVDLRDEVAQMHLKLIYTVDVNNKKVEIYSSK